MDKNRKTSDRDRHRHREKETETESTALLGSDTCWSGWASRIGPCSVRVDPGAAHPWSLFERLDGEGGLTPRQMPHSAQSCRSGTNHCYTYPGHDVVDVTSGGGGWRSVMSLKKKTFWIGTTKIALGSYWKSKWSLLKNKNLVYSRPIIWKNWLSV